MMNGFDVIIGAGITGLAYAGFSSKPCVILEKDDHIGGMCNTIKQDGFIWDYSGHFFHFQRQAMGAYVQDRMNADDIVNVQKRTQIKYKDRYIDFPFQKNIHQLEYNEFVDCLCDLFETGAVAVDSFKSMLYSKFGKSISDKFLIPYNEKLYAIDLDRLDVDSMGRYFPYADREEIIRNFRRQKNDSYNGTFMYPKGGAIQYVNAIARDIPAQTISLNETVVNVDLRKHVVQTNRRFIEYKHLISTVPLIDLVELTDLPCQKDAFSWNKVLVFNLGFDAPSDDRANHWIYYPEKRYCFYRVGFYSNIIPSERMSLYVEIGLSKDAEVDVDRMLQNTLRDLQDAGVVSTQKLVSWHFVLMNPAYVHVTRQGIAETQRIKRQLADSDVYSIGRYGSWNYSSIEDNMVEAMELVKRLEKEQ